MASGFNVPNVTNQPQAVSKEYYVKVPSRTKKRYHALKFHNSLVDLSSWTKADMARDMTIQQNQRQETESMSKEGKEPNKKRRFMNIPKKISPEDQPWILSNKSNEKAPRQFIGKKSVSENSSYFVFIKCADGGFEAWPLEDWYSFAPHKTYKTLNHEEAEEEYKRRNKVLNKYTIMANKRKTDNNGEEDEEGEGESKGGSSSFGIGPKSKDAWVSDGEEDSKKKKKKNYKSSNLSDDDEEEKEEEDEFDDSSKLKKKKSKRKDSGSEDELKGKEDSDDGDHEGVEKDYSSSDSSIDSEPETSKFEEKYQQKGIDEEEAIKAQNKSDDSESEEEEEGLTEEGKEYRRKLMAKDQDENESEELEDKGKTGKDDDSKDSSSSFDESDLESDLAKEKKAKYAQSTENKLKRKASDDLLQAKNKKKPNKNQTNVQTHDESSSSSSTSAPNLTKSSKTAAVIAAANASKLGTVPSNATSNSVTPISSTSAAAVTSRESNNSVLSEEEVRRYLSRKMMTSKELLQKFKSKTQNTMTNEQLVNSIRSILDKLKCKIVEKNGVKYLSLP